MKIILLSIPLLLLLLVISSTVFAIYLYAKAKGDFKGMTDGTKKLFIASSLFPLVLLVSTLILLGLFSSNAHNKLEDDIRTGALIVHRVAEVDTVRPQKVFFKDNAGFPYLSFDIFEDNLYAELKDGDVTIRTSEFEGSSQIKENSLGFVRFSRHGSVLPDAKEYEERLKKDGTNYVKSETALGTVLEVEEKEDYLNSRRFLYKLYFKDSDYSMLISVSYSNENDLSVRYSPVVSREYAQKLYELIKSTIEVDSAKLHAVYNLEAI